MKFVDLPQDALVHILKHVETEDMVRAAATCTSVYDAACVQSDNERLIVTVPDYTRGTGKYQELYDFVKAHEEEIREAVFDYDFQREISWRIPADAAAEEIFRIFEKYEPLLCTREHILYARQVLLHYDMRWNPMTFLTREKQCSRYRDSVMAWLRKLGYSRTRSHVASALRRHRMYSMPLGWLFSDPPCDKTSRYHETLLMDAVLLDLRDVLEKISFDMSSV